jgi:ribonuclease P protein component
VRAIADIRAAQDSQGFNPGDRLHKRFEYRRVQSTGLRVHGSRFLWLVSPRKRPHRANSAAAAAASTLDGNDPLQTTRLGVTITKKVAHAVGRNRIRRVVREVFRRNRSLLPEGIDLVAIAKREAVDLSFQDCLDEMTRAAPALHTPAKKPPPKPQAAASGGQP